MRPTTPTVSRTMRRSRPQPQRQRARALSCFLVAVATVVVAAALAPTAEASAATAGTLAATNPVENAAAYTLASQIVEKQGAAAEEDTGDAKTQVRKKE
jgi:hypothetical protein